MEQVSPENVPLRGGTFWSWQLKDNFPPTPYNPFPTLPLYVLDTNMFIYDDSGANYLGRGMMLLESDGPPPPPGGGGGDPEPGQEPEPEPWSPPNYGTNTLWLEITGVTTNGFANLIVHGTVPDTAYEILSRVSVTNTFWLSEGMIIGALEQNWTPIQVPVGTRTNTLFFSAKSWLDSDGSGLPDWWQTQFFGHLGVDPYSDPDGDGWNNWEEYQNGTNPNGFNTPRAPQGLQVNMGSNGITATLRWVASSGPVSGYTIERSFTNQPIQVSSGTTQVTDNTAALTDPLYIEENAPQFRLRVNYPAGSSAWSDWVTPPECRGVQAQAVSIANGQLLLAAAGLGSASNLRLELWTYNASTFHYEFASNLDIPAGNLSNATVAISEPLASAANSGLLYARAVSSNNVPGGVLLLNGISGGVRAFRDARMQLRENLRFLLRSATTTLPFFYTSGIRTDGAAEEPPLLSHIWHPDIFFARPPSSTEYEHSSYRIYSFGLDDYELSTLRPVQENFLLRNFTFNTADVTNGVFQTGASFDIYDLVRTLEEPNYVYPGDGSGSPLPSAMQSTNFNWAMSSWAFGDDDTTLADLGLYLAANPTGVPSVFWDYNVRNIYGLPINGVLFKSRNGWYTNAVPGGVGIRVPDASFYFVQAAEPILQTVDYYFSSDTPYLRYNMLPYAPQPGAPNFSITNTSPLLIAPVGQPYAVSGWARQAILNGYTNRFAYLQQYFDTAYKMTNDLITTNVTGILSPYGEFFPTEPGRAALVTMPDLDNGQRGTATVYCVKMELDVNHDGTINRSLSGPDNTSADHPFVFWLNSDNDGYDGNEHEPEWRQDFQDNTINYIRDLEDFARLWISGVPALASTNGYAVTLSWRNTGGSHPSIKLYPAYEIDGGNQYLQDIDVAAHQVSYVNQYNVLSGPGASLGTVGIDSPYTFPTNYFETYSRKHFLFEGAGIGSGELVLTISQGTNILAESSAWLDLRNVTTMYEQAHIAETPDAPPSSTLSDQSTYVEDYTLTDDPNELRQCIVFIHGWRMPIPDYFAFSSTMFKRLYWTGYQGRFVSLRWPCLSAETDGSTGQYLTFNRSEYISFKSARGAEEYLRHLHDRLPGYSLNIAAHSQGGIVMMETLNRFVQHGNTVIDNLVLMQAAVPAHCYDTNVANYPLFVLSENDNPTPDSYRGYGVNIGTGVIGQIVNFYNTNDFAVSRAWEDNQTLEKPTGRFGYVHDAQTGTSYRMSRTLTDTTEIMSFVARPRSKGVGARGGVVGAIGGGEVDLKLNFNFNTDKQDHSAQFNWNIQQLRPFYLTLMDKLLAD